MTTKPIKVLHITAHLGGGVGRVLSSISKYSIESNSQFEHTIVTLEHPIKFESSNRILNSGGRLIIHPSITYLNQLIQQSDIVQLEWWNHPTTKKYLQHISPSQIRLLTWYHNNKITEATRHLLLNSHIFLFTTESSLRYSEIKLLVPTHEDHLGVVYASGGFDDFPIPRNRENEQLSIGYFGAIKFDKMHPNYSKYLSELSKISIPNIKINIIGDTTSLESVFTMNTLIKETNSDIQLNFTGYLKNPIKELNKLNVLAYILNPNHYGTTENSLLQSMAMGIVPIVLNNPPEQNIITNYRTGFIIKNPEEFSDIIQVLYENPIIRQITGENASEYVRKKFSIENIVNQLNDYYNKVMSMEKRKIDFKEIFNLCQNC